MSAIIFLVSYAFLSLIGTENTQGFIHLLEQCLVPLVHSSISEIFEQGWEIKHRTSGKPMLSGLATGCYVECGHQVALDSRMLRSNTLVKPIMI